MDNAKGKSILEVKLTAFVNTHMLSEVVVPAESLLATYNRADIR